MAFKIPGIACSLVIVSMSFVMLFVVGCTSKATLTTEESEEYEVEELKGIIYDIRNDASMSPKEQELAIRQLEQRLETMTGKK